MDNAEIQDLIDRLEDLKQRQVDLMQEQIKLTKDDAARAWHLPFLYSGR